MRILVFLLLVLCLSYSQVVIDSIPASINAYVSETINLTFDGDLNSINGASWIASFIIASNSPSQPSWATLNGMTLSLAPPTIADMGIYEMQFEVTETGTGSWTFIPHNRRLSISVHKRPPIINYSIPDYNDMRAAVPFEIVFPSVPWIDPLDDTITYELLDQNNVALFNGFSYDSSGTGRIYGTIPNSQAGTYYIRLIWNDSQNQRIQQDFTMYFVANNNPQQAVTDLTPYYFEIPEGVNSTYILPVGIYTDSDGDSIQYDFWFFENYAALSTVGWATFYPGIEGVAYINFVEPTPTIHTGFNFMLSDGISTSTGPVLINFTFNNSPILSSNPLNILVYPNSTFTTVIDLSTYFSDPEDQALTYSSHTLPSEVTITAVTTSQLKIDVDFTSSFPSLDLTFYFSATDGASKPTDLQVSYLKDCIGKFAAK
jgi:hypothetical protein